MLKIEAAGPAYSPCGDRFITEGYREGLDLESQIERLARIDGITGPPIMFPLEIDKDRLANLLVKHGFQLGTVCPDTYCKPEWKFGTLASSDKAIREKAIRLCKDSMDFCAEMNGADILIWLAHDGYDYPFEDDYETRFGRIIDGLGEIASHNANVRVTIEYKAKEPRTHQYVSDAAKALLICETVNAPNLGVVIDLGHSLQAGEEPAEAVSLVARYGRLFHIHLNDNFRTWDDDLLIGGVHFWETLEFFYWLQKYGYDGWYVIDIWPSRVNGEQSIIESVERIRMFDSLARSLPREQIVKLQEQNETMEIMRVIRESVFK